jgi:hypothetical protein
LPLAIASLSLAIIARVSPPAPVVGTPSEAMPIGQIVIVIAVAG